MSFHVLKHMFTRCLGVIACVVVLITTISAHAQTSSVYWTNAQNTHNFVYATLLTSYNSYRIEPGNSTTHEWYNVSQIYADTALYKEGDTRYAPYVNNTYSFMNHMWANTRVGGYYAAANIDGTGAAGDQYVDDNSLAGNVYLDAYEATLQQAAYLASAEAIANWLMYSGLWDNTYGGGFWWSTQKQVKPTQSNGLALQLLDENTAWLDYAQQNIAFMNKNLLNSANGGYNQWVGVDGTGRTSTYEAVDQAWMERTQALLALYR